MCRLARILTGVGYVSQADPPKLDRGGICDGLFQFDSAKHASGKKTLLGHKIKGSGYSEVTAALDLLSSQPAMAQHNSRQFTQFFMRDTPPPAIVDAMAARFLSSDASIAAVLATLFAALEFTAGGTAFKNPMHYTLSAIRLVHDGRRITDPCPLATWLNLQGEGLYVRQTREGYPLNNDEWAGPSQLAAQFDISRTFVMPGSELFMRDHVSITTPDIAPLPQRLAAAGLFPKLEPATPVALHETANEHDWSALLLSSPDFMRR